MRSTRDDFFVYKLRPEQGDIIANALDHYLSEYGDDLPVHVIRDVEVMIAQMDFLSGNFFVSEEGEDYDNPDYDPHSWWYEDDPDAAYEEYEVVEVIGKNGSTETTVIGTKENVVCLATARATKESSKEG